MRCCLKQGDTKLKRGCSSFPVSGTMRASSPTNYLQCLSQPAKVSPRRGEGTPPYRTFVGLQRVIKSSVGNGFDRSGPLPHYAIIGFIADPCPVQSQRAAISFPIGGRTMCAPYGGARQITADFYGKTKSPHPYGCGPEKLKRSEITYSSLHPGGRADPRRRAYTGCRGHGHTCRSRGGSCRGLPPTADGRGRGGYSPQSRCRGKRAGSR